jgi:hypothetical protein
MPVAPGQGACAFCSKAMLKNIVDFNQQANNTAFYKKNRALKWAPECKKEREKLGKQVS